MNKVVAGSYAGASIGSSFLAGGLYLMKGMQKISVNKNTVARYDVVNEQDTRSFGRAFLYGAAGAAVLGTLGAVGGFLLSKRKEYVVSLEFNDGNNALLQVDKGTFEKILRALY